MLHRNIAHARMLIDKTYTLVIMLMAVSDKTSQQQAWLDLQQQYWTVWQNLMQQVLQPSTPASTQAKPTDDTSQDKWKTFAAELFVTDTAQQTVQQFVKQSKNYLAFNEIFLGIIEKLPTVEKESVKWRNLWEEGFSVWENKLTEWLPEAINPASVWALPLDNWLRTASSLSTLPGDVLQSVKNDLNSAIENSESPKYEELMAMLGLGYSGKWQTQYQEGVRRWKTYQTAQQDYTAQFNELIVQALTRMREKIFTSAIEAPITDLRTLYDLWIESSEMTYIELVNSDAYAEKNANLINSLMAWKQHQQRMVDEILCALHMPTRREFNSLGQRLHALRRETRALPIHEEQDVSQLEELRQELNALRIEVTTLKNTRSRRNTPTKSSPKGKETGSDRVSRKSPRTRKTDPTTAETETGSTSAVTSHSVNPLKPTGN